MTLIDSELKYVLTDITRSGDLCLYSIKPAQTLATLLIPRPQPVRTPLQSHLVPHSNKSSPRQPLFSNLEPNESSDGWQLS